MMHTNPITECVPCQARDDDLTLANIHRALEEMERAAGRHWATVQNFRLIARDLDGIPTSSMCGYTDIPSIPLATTRAIAWQDAANILRAMLGMEPLDSLMSRPYVDPHVLAAREARDLEERLRLRTVERLERMAEEVPR